MCPQELHVLRPVHGPNGSNKRRIPDEASRSSPNTHKVEARKRKDDPAVPHHHIIASSHHRVTLQLERSSLPWFVCQLIVLGDYLVAVVTAAATDPMCRVCRR